MADNQELQERPRLVVNNYTDIWKWDLVLYAVHGHKLPWPANLKVLAIFTVNVFVFMFLGHTLLFFLPFTWKYIAAPAGVTYLLHKLKLDGKDPHKWMWGMILFLLRPKTLYRYQKVKHLNHYVYKANIPYRLRERA